MSTSMPTRWQIEKHAEPGDRFAPGAFDSQIGKQIPVIIAEQVSLLGTLVAADVTDDGRSVTLTVDTLIPVTPEGGLAAWNVGWTTERSAGVR
ncbi:hypothetical protein [Nonomuraea zeae]|uniref:Uncharacterized protein n=1 Tax=Nonomuraea zeae TaxID=1642303 RepID=A0A5S4GFG8_9ACTN|nr:hypothetical protein [Nonomuraea zeae]TMR31715.1 hypothetical protein ETD85_24765 [Nonomuraea zeae]